MAMSSTATPAALTDYTAAMRPVLPEATRTLTRRVGASTSALP